jgi:hypothetical protein
VKFNKDIILLDKFIYIVIVWFWKNRFLAEIIAAVIVFKPGLMADPVQGLGSGFWLGHREPESIFFLNQNDVVLFKKQKSTGCNQVFDRVLPGQPAGSHRVFHSPIFSSTWPGSSPESTRRAGPGFKTMNVVSWIATIRASPMGNAILKSQIDKMTFWIVQI